MSRRDVIIIAVLLNAAVLSFLFFTATRPEEEATFQPSMQQPVVIEPIPTPMLEPRQDILAVESAPRDEIDNVIKPYLSQEPQMASIPQEIVLQPQSQPEVMAVPSNQLVVTAETTPQYREVTVKRGDVLEKLARANGTSVKEIKRINNLTTDRISVGQVLKVPPRSPNDPTHNDSTRVVAQKQESAPVATAAQYYTIKAGDNLWKIAKQNSVKLDDLLRLNNLTEEKARNLKIGDKIRVR